MEILSSNTVQLNVYVVLVALELLFVFIGLTVFLLLRNSGQSAQAVPDPAVSEKESSQHEAWNYATWLRDELLRSEGLLDSLAEAGESDADQDGEQAGVAELLGMRHAFLKIELASMDLMDDPEAYREKLQTDLRALLEIYRPSPLQIEVAAEAVEEEPGDDAPATGTGIQALDRSDEELLRLKEVITHQHDVMRELRKSLEGQNEGSEEWEEIQRKLEAADRQGLELARCVEVLEEENQRLKTSMQKPGTASGSADRHGAGSRGEGKTEDFDDLRSLIGDQQETISNLHRLLREIEPSAEKAEQMEVMIGSMQRANQELNGCLMVLEDENELLRQRVESLETRVNGEAEDTDEAGSDEEARLQEKLKELEVQLEFRDLSIQELQAQYQELESKYQELKAVSSIA